MGSLSPSLNIEETFLLSSISKTKWSYFMLRNMFPVIGYTNRYIHWSLFVDNHPRGCVLVALSQIWTHLKSVIARLGVDTLTRIK